MAAKSRKEARLRTVYAVTDILWMICERGRLTTVSMLERGETSQAAIVEACGKELYNVSYHLAQMLRCGVVTRIPRGRRIFFALTDRGRILAELAREVGDLLRRLPEE